MSLQRQKGRASGILAAAALSGVCLVGGGQFAWAAEDAPPAAEAGGLQNTLVDVNLVEATLPVAINLLKQRTGLQIVIVNQMYQYGKVTVSLRARPARDVLRLIAESAGADFWEKDGICFIGPKGSGPKPAPDLGAQMIESPEPPRPRAHFEKIKLRYTDPQTILRILGVTNQGRAEAIDLFHQSVIRTFLPTDFNTSTLNPYALAKPGAIQMVPTGQTATITPAVPTRENASPVAPGSYAAPTSSGNGGDQNANRDLGMPEEFGRGGQFPGGGGFGGGGQPGGFGGAGGFGGQGAGGLGGAGGFGGGQFGQGGLGQGQGAAQQLLNSIGVQPGELFALDSDNSIITTTTDPQSRQLLIDLIKLLDVKPRQLMIKAEFVTVSQNDVNSFGINWSFQKVNLVGGVSTGFQTANTAFLQYAAGNVQAQLSFILTQNRGKLVAAPVVTTVNNAPVSITFTRTIPVILSTPVFTGFGTSALAPSIVPVPVVTGLFVLPRINGDESITMFGQVFSSNVESFVTGPQGASAPITQVIQAPVQRIIRNGDTMVVGGLIRKATNVATNKVPLLGDLPLIGSLFQSRNTTVDDSELLVFITPSIIPERAPLTGIGGLGSGPGGGLGAGAGAVPGAAGGGIMP
jgi:general secretion pathway protein D